MSISYSAEAVADLADVIVYGNNVWGFEQAIQYLNLLEASISTLVDFPQIGRVDEVFAPGHRWRLFQDHRVIYDYDGATVTVLRVVHRRVDYRALLRGGPE